MKRTFVLGDEWIYYKLYCGKKVADSILVDVIKPLTQNMLSQGLIDQWFFIRYLDPEPHLRIRFHCNKTTNLSLIIEEVKIAINYYVENDLIWNVQLDTYQREIERYGEETMVVSENLFYIDSTICVGALSLIEDDKILFMLSLRLIDDFLDFFRLTINEKIVFVKENMTGFKTEFNTNKNLTKQLNKKYRDLKPQIIEFMEMEEHVEYQPIIDLLNFKKKQLDNVLDKKIVMNPKVIDKLLPSYIHMTVNRLFRDQQRLHELVCYDNLYRFYNFKLAKSKV